MYSHTHTHTPLKSSGLRAGYQVCFLSKAQAENLAHTVFLSSNRHLSAHSSQFTAHTHTNTHTHTHTHTTVKMQSKGFFLLARLNYVSLGELTVCSSPCEPFTTLRFTHNLNTAGTFHPTEHPPMVVFLFRWGGGGECTHT